MCEGVCRYVRGGVFMYMYMWSYMAVCVGRYVLCGGVCRYLCVCRCGFFLCETLCTCLHKWLTFINGVP